MINQVQLIDKSLINQFSFSSEDVLQDQALKFRRRQRLLKALKLGNLNKQHVRINFVDSSGVEMKTRATVWAVTQKHVVLKSSTMIPISSIKCIEI